MIKTMAIKIKSVVHRVILHSLGTQLHHTQPSGLCGTAGHLTHAVWPHTPHNQYIFSQLSDKSLHADIT